MTHSTGQFPNDTYLEGLRNNPESTLAVLYNEFRANVLYHLVADRKISDLMSTRSFQLAVLDLAQLAQTGQFPPERTVADVLDELTRAHYTDMEREYWETPAETEETSETGTPEHLAAAPLLTLEARRKSREKVMAWSLLAQLDESCRQLLLAPSDTEMPGETNSDMPTAPTPESCKSEFLALLSPKDEPLERIPEWASEALADTGGYAMWRRTEVLEAEWAAEEPLPTESNRIWRWAIGLLLLAVVGYGAYQFYFRPKTAAEVFADNFSPPGSLMDDLQARYGAEMGNDSATARPGECMLLLREADAYYQAHEYQLAMDPLLLIVMDSASICQSDAWFYLGIVQLHLEDPATAIQCFAKIEDLGKFGEDLYWYQALAFVQLAKENPLMRDRARRAVERALGNTRNPKRQEQAQKMLDNLSH